MLLSPNSEEFFGFDPFDRFRSVLPTTEAMNAKDLSGFYAANFSGPEALVGAQTENAMRILQHSIGTDAVNFGVLEDQVATLGTMYRSLQSIAVFAEVGKVLKVTGGVIQSIRVVMEASEALMAISDTIDAFASRVPIIGWVVKIGVGLYKVGRFIYDAVKSASKQDIPPPQAAVMFSQRQDEAQAQLGLELARSSDWTDLFRPPSTEPWQWRWIDTANTGKRTGLFVEPRDSEPGRLGCFPQLAEQFTFYQWTEGDLLNKHTVGKRGPGRGGYGRRGGTIISGTQFHPSMAQFSMSLWQRVLSYGPRMFDVDMSRIVTEWGDFYGHGFELVRNASRMYDGEGDKGDDYQDRLRSLYPSLSFASWFPGSVKGGVKPKFSKPRYERFDPAKMPSKYLAPETIYPPGAGRPNENTWFPLSNANLIRYVHDEIWRPQAIAALKTLACAYVSPDAVALRSDDGLADLHHEMRSRLLRSKWVHEVDPTSIPDQDYRNDVEQAQRFIGGLVAPTEPDSRPKILVGGLAAIVPVDPPEPPDGGGMDPGIEGSDGDTGGSGVGGLLVGAAVAAAAAAFLRR